MSPRSSLLLVSAGLLALSAGASAQPPAGHSAGKPPAVRTELKSELERHFDAVDANHDGTMTPEERATHHQGMRARMRDRMFARLDADKNGSISKAEFEAASTHREGGMRDRRSARGPEGARHHHGPRGGHMAGAMMLRHELAAYKDKPITKAQFVDAGLGLFDRADTDHDGKISPAERDAARRAMRDRPAPAHRPPPPPPGL